MERGHGMTPPAYGRSRRRIALFWLSLFYFFSLFPLSAQVIDRFSSRASVGGSFPLGGDAQVYSPGYGFGASVDFMALRYLYPSIHGGMVSQPLQSLDALSVGFGGVGLGFVYYPFERFRTELEARGGIYSSTWQETKSGGYYAGAGLELGYAVSPVFTLSASVGFSRYFGVEDPLLTALSAGVSASIKFGELGRRKSLVDITLNRLDQVFPVFYSYYDDHSFGSVTLTNGEDGEIRDVSVYFSSSEYMAQPKLCSSFSSIAKGKSVTSPVYAIFSDEVLSLTENAKLPGEVIVEYSLLGSKREARTSLTMQLNHRNAMTWDDDKKAASFVSPTDPAVLWFSKFVSGIVRDRLRGDISRNLQYAAGMFETLTLYGLNYVIDPTSSYVEKSSSDFVIDYLQYPHQTLFFRGGDCDDLSILFCSLLESVGIRTAFITIPGHIFMAFSLGMTEKEAKASFYDPSILLYREGQAWVPVEITMLKDGFVKAWRVGAKEWNDSEKAGTAALYPMTDSWKLYPPAGIPDVNPRFVLPEEDATIVAFDESIDKYVAREIDPVVKELKLVAEIENSPEKENELGILYGRYGMLEEAWDHFTKAAKGNYPHAWTNLANIAFLQKDYKLALSYYEWALSLDPEDTPAILGLARSHYELEDFKSADTAYAELKLKDPSLAIEYGYLGSIIGGEGRAWSFSDRLSSTTWRRDKDATELRLAQQEQQKKQEPEKKAPEPVKQVPAAQTSKDQENGRGSEVKAQSFTPPIVEQTPPKDEKIVQIQKPETPTVSKQEEPKKTVSEEKPQNTAPPVIEKKPPQEEKHTQVQKSEPPQLTKPEEPKKTVSEEKPQNTAPPAIEKKPPQEERRTQVQKPEPPQTSKQEEPKKAVSEVPPQIGKLPEESSSKKETPEASVPEEQKTTVPVVSPVIVDLPKETEKIEVPQKPVPQVIEEKKGSGDWKPVSEGFASSIPAIGTWEGAWNLGGKMVYQADAETYYGKLVTPAAQNAKKLRYSVSCRSDGKYWTGVGMHILGGKVKTHKGFGEGTSILVWLTYDPKHYGGDKSTRLQVYRSKNDVNMDMKEDITIPESIFASNSLEIEIDRETGVLTVLMNGNERLSCDGFSGTEDGLSVVFRALDKAEFSDFRVEELP